MLMMAAVIMMRRCRVARGTWFPSRRMLDERFETRHASWRAVPIDDFTRENAGTDLGTSCLNPFL